MRAHANFSSPGRCSYWHLNEHTEKGIGVKMNGSRTRRSDFAEHLSATNVGGSGKASSYLRALELLEEMLKAAPMGFEDCQNLWRVDSAERLIELRLQVLEEQKRGQESPWVREGIPVSYLRDGYCSAALTQLVESHHRLG